jgi:hypothetical protein
MLEVAAMIVCAHWGGFSIYDSFSKDYIFKAPFAWVLFQLMSAKYLRDVGRSTRQHDWTKILFQSIVYKVFCCAKPIVENGFVDTSCIPNAYPIGPSTFCDKL